MQLALLQVDKDLENLTPSQVKAFRGKDKGQNLWPGIKLVSTLWPADTPLNPQHLQIIVELPSGKRCVH